MIVGQSDSQGRVQGSGKGVDCAEPTVGVSFVLGGGRACLDLLLISMPLNPKPETPNWSSRGSSA